ncbi:hypothetical protein ACETK8_19390 [Brevundimonas staleyi]|uniref:Uncharacterized protein n=1 Tax=Brevundimonas staleyi TaxID=74326 RepID=A0ABW0FQI7_9CAUL
MTKTLLLTAAAVTALVAAGSAQAGSLSARAGTAPIAVAPNNPYKLARELNFGSGVQGSVGQFDTIFTFNNALAAGSYTVTLAYSGATITTALPTTTVNSAGAGNVGGVDTTNALGFEVASAAGGNGPSQLTVTSQTSTQITFALQIPAGNTVTSIYASPAILVTGPMSVTAAVTNQVTGAVVDPAVIQPLITTNNQAFAARTNRAITAADSNAFNGGAGLDTRIAEGAAPVFTTLTNPGQIGQVDVAVAGTVAFDTIVQPAAASTAVYRDLNGSAVTLADVTSATINVTGIFTGLTSTANDSAGGPIAASAITSPTATSRQVVAPGGANIGTTTFLVNPTGGAGAPQLQPSDYDVSVQLALASGFAAPAAFTGTFETIQTDGFSYIIPWVASQTQSGASGNQSVIRVSNIRADASTAGGRVYVQVYNPSTGNAGLSAGRSTFIGTLGTSGELVITSQSLEAALGNFGRADLRLTIATTATTGNALPGAAPVGASTIVVKRLIQTSNGGLTEVEIVAGDASSATNLPVNQGVNY